MAGLEATNLHDFQKEMLAALKDLKQSLVHAINTVPAGGDNSEQEKTIKRLEEENRKQAYRIEHLVRNLTTRV